MSEPKKLGELVVVAIEARNLVTRDFIGKGDPFVTFRIGEDAKRIKAEKRGGQTPKWDEEVRFTLMESGSKKMKIQVFNEDKREHDLIGDAIIDLAQVLDKCEWDEWHEIRYRNKYAGEVLLEMTFYYAAKPPAAQMQAAAGVANHSRPQPTVPPQTQATFSSPPNSFGPSATPYTPPITNQAPTSAPPSTGYPPYPPSAQNIYPPPISKSPPPNTYPTYSTSPPQSQPPQIFGPQRTQSPVSNQYPPVSSSGYPPPVSQGQNMYPAQGPTQGYPPPYNATPPQSNSSQGINMAFPVPVPTPNGPPGFGGQYPSYNNGYPPAPRPPVSGGYQQSPYPPNNIYPPSTGGYPPPHSQGYPPNPYPPGPY